MMINEIELLYNILELKYLEKNGYESKDLKNVFLEIYPFRWFETKDYKDKIMILAEAINENKLIVETNSYNELTKDVIL